MNHALVPAAFLERQPTLPCPGPEEAARHKRIRSLLGLFALYATALGLVLALSDGADIGCILGAIAGHVLYATHRIVTTWRNASWLDQARDRLAGRVAV